MDRALDDVISERQRRNNRGPKIRRQSNWPHDDSRKLNGRANTANIDIDWIHDKYEDDTQTRRPSRGPRNIRIDQYSPEIDPIAAGAKLRVDNLHYDLTEDDLEGLFNRIGPVTTLSLRFDRAGRSSGTAFVTYASLHDARAAIREFDGANANGQPIRLTLTPSAPSAARDETHHVIRGRGAIARARNPFDTAVKPGRSLFDRIENPDRRSRGQASAVGRSRSRSPGAPRRTDTSKPAPEGVDRYVPSPAVSRNGPRRRSRSSSFAPAARGRRGGRDRDREGGREKAIIVNGRVRKRQEELDREMEEYWREAGLEVEGNGAAAHANGAGGGALAGAEAVVVTEDGDVEMCE